ncbi:hypothetical protein FVE85_9491 [Porphyridium purpureum]|uniref:Uncharacterized protein n=1 Tax=Porphyridium purpureum TaxID=35688 RepID=A0A5J4YI90_PORPP|nr:hypothetical protein FVE85_9491 [Porphyridium purpureum]|eukprot:POR0739..scf261_15
MQAPSAVWLVGAFVGAAAALWMSVWLARRIADWVQPEHPRNAYGMLSAHDSSSAGRLETPGARYRRSIRQMMREQDVYRRPWPERMLDVPYLLSQRHAWFLAHVASLFAVHGNTRVILRRMLDFATAYYSDYAQKHARFFPHECGDVIDDEEQDSMGAEAGASADEATPSSAAAAVSTGMEAEAAWPMLEKEWYSVRHAGADPRGMQALLRSKLLAAALRTHAERDGASTSQQRQIASDAQAMEPRSKSYKVYRSNPFDLEALPERAQPVATVPELAQLGIFDARVRLRHHIFLLAVQRECGLASPSDALSFIIDALKSDPRFREQYALDPFNARIT